MPFPSSGQAGVMLTNTYASGTTPPMTTGTTVTATEGGEYVMVRAT